MTWAVFAAGILFGWAWLAAAVPFAIWAGRRIARRTP